MLGFYPEVHCKRAQRNIPAAVMAPSIDGEIVNKLKWQSIQLQIILFCW